MKKQLFNTFHSFLIDIDNIENKIIYCIASADIKKMF